MKDSSIIEKCISVVAYLFMIGLNILGNVLPLGGLTTGEISDKYPSLISPAGYTFSIWGAVYILLFLFVVYQLGLIKNRNEKLMPELYSLIRILFVISSLCNAAWIIAWHYEYLALALMLSVIILICLILINKHMYAEELSLAEKLFIRFPFGIYFSWISVATVLNTTVLLVSIRWSGFGVSALIWSIIVIILATLLTVVVSLKLRSIAYIVPVLWAFGGIMTKHLFQEELQGKYPELIVTLIICSLLLLTEIFYVTYHKKSYEV